MAHEKEDASREYQKRQLKKLTSQRVDGRRLHLTGTRDAIGLVQAESESEEEHSAASPPAQQATSFAEILIEVKTVSNNAIAAQPTDEQNARLTATRDRTVRKPQLLTQPVTYGLPVDNREELASREKNIENARTRLRIRTGIALCESQHVVLVCLWSLDDPVNRKGTWRLHRDDYRHETSFFTNGVEDHKHCDCWSTARFLDMLGKRMIADFEKNVDYHWNNRTPKDIEMDRRNMVEKKESPGLHQITRALGPLVMFTVPGEVNDDQEKNNNNKKRVRKDMEKKGGLNERLSRCDKGGKLRQSRLERAQARASARRKGDEATSNELINKQNDRRKSDKTPVKQAGEPHAKNQRIDTAVPNYLAELKNRMYSGQGKGKLGINETEQDILRRIRAAEQEEAEKIDQTEDQEEQQQNFATEEETTATQQQKEDQGNEDLLVVINEAIENAPPESESAEGLAAGTKRKASRSRLSRVEFAPNSPSDADSSSNLQPGEALPRKKRPKQDLDSATTHPHNKSDGSEPAASIDSSKSTKPFAERPLGRTSGRLNKQPDEIESQEQIKERKKPNSSSKTPAKSTAHKKPTAKTRSGKAYESEGFITNSDLENGDKEDIELRTDKLNARKVIVKIASTEQASTTTEQDGNTFEHTTEATTVAVETQHDGGSSGCTEVTELKTVSSKSSEHDEGVTVQRAIHLEPVAALEVPGQDLPRDSPPPSPAYEMLEGFNTPTSAIGIEVLVSSPVMSHQTPSSPDVDSDTSSSSMKRKRKPNANERDTTSAHSDKLPSPKKRRITPSSLPTEKNAGADTSSSSSAQRASSSDSLLSPGAISVSSSASSTSSRKRRMVWSEEDGEVTISPGGTKHVKRVRSKTGVNQAISKETEEAVEHQKVTESDGMFERNKVKEGENEEQDGVSALEFASIGIRDKDEDEFDSLFGSQRARTATMHFSKNPSATVSLDQIGLDSSTGGSTKQ